MYFKQLFIPSYFGFGFLKQEEGAVINGATFYSYFLGEEKVHDIVVSPEGVEVIHYFKGAILNRTFSKSFNLALTEALKRIHLNTDKRFKELQNKLSGSYNGLTFDIQANRDLVSIPAGYNFDIHIPINILDEGEFWASYSFLSDNFASARHYQGAVFIEGGDDGVSIIASSFARFSCTLAQLPSALQLLSENIEFNNNVIPVLVTEQAPVVDGGLGKFRILRAAENKKLGFCDFVPINGHKKALKQKFIDAISLQTMI